MNLCSSLSRVCLVVISLMQVSCVIGKREANVPVTSGSHPAVKGHAKFQSVVDARQFENSPEQPSTPSVQGDYSTLSAAQRENYIGRQRNGYGKGMGEVVLPANGMLTAKMREILTEALARRGYAADGSGTAIDVKIQQFWGWMTPGMWAITLEARITASVKANGRTASLSGYGENVCQAATTGNWELAYQRAVDNLLEQSGAALGSIGL